MKKYNTKAILDAIEVTINSGHKVVKATSFLSKNEIVRVVRKSYGGKFSPGNIELILTIGKPNYAEREQIKKFRKEHAEFPIAGIVKLLKAPKKKLKK